MYMEQMPCFDRSKELMLIVQRYKSKSQFAPLNNLSKNKNLKPNNINIESFKNVTKYLSNMLQQTEMKLCQLQVFLDMDNFNYSKDHPKVDNLTEIIMSDLSDLTKLFTQMQELLKLTTSKLPFNVQRRAHLSSIALHIQQRFQELSKKFKDCVKTKENLWKRSQKNEHVQFSPYNHEMSAPATAPDNYGDNRPVAPSCQLSMTAIDNELRQRDKSVKDVEATIVQLGDVFEQFSCVVQEQEELVRDIACHATSAFLDIEEAHSQLAKYFREIKSHRSLMLRVFAILAILILIFTYIL